MTTSDSASQTQDALKKSLDILRDGGILLMPTDTIWGLSCDATNEAAVEKLIRLKQRPAEKSFIILTDADYKLEQYVEEVPAVAYDLIEFAENPLTIIFSGAKRLAPNVINRDGSVGIRVVKQQGFCRKLLERFRKPIVSTSANLSGQPAPASPGEVAPEILKEVDYVVPAAAAAAFASATRPGIASPAPLAGPGKASTIIRLGTGGEYTLIRK